MSLLLLCGLLLFWLVLVVCCWAFLVLARVFSSYSEFIQGDLCLSAHTAPVPVQKKHIRALLPKTRTEALTKNGLYSYVFLPSF